MPQQNSASLHNPILSDKLQNLSGLNFLQKFISTAIGIGFLLGFIVFFFILLLGAIKWITAGGDKASIEAAQKTIANALIGLVVLLSIFAIIAFIGGIFGTDLLNIKIPTL